MGLFGGSYGGVLAVPGSSATATGSITLGGLAVGSVASGDGVITTRGIYGGGAPPPAPNPSSPGWQVLMAFGFGPLDPNPIWTDVSTWMRTFDYGDGRQHELDRMEAGQLQMQLNDRLGEFTPGNTLSPFYNLLGKDDALGLEGTWGPLAGGGAVATQTSALLWGPTGGVIEPVAAPSSYSTGTGTAGYPVQPFQTYYGSVWMKAATVAEPLSIEVIFYDSGGAPLGGTTSALITDSTTAWTQYTVFAVAPSNAATAALAILDGASTGNHHYFTCCMLSLNPTGVPVSWNQGQYGPLVPDMPIWIRGSWNDVVYPYAYCFADAWTPITTDPVNQDTTVTAYDVLGLLGVSPLSNTTLFPDLILSYTPANYWRLSDPIGSGQAQSAISGQPLVPLVDLGNTYPAPKFGSQDTTGAGLAALLTASFTGGGSGAILYDTATAATFDVPQGSGTAGVLDSALMAAEPLFGSDTDWSWSTLINIGSTPTGVNTGPPYGNTSILVAEFNHDLGNPAFSNATIQIDGVTGQTSFGWEAFTGITLLGTGNTGYVGPDLFDNRWHQIAITVQQSGTAILYVDGVAFGSCAISYPTDPTGAGWSAYNKVPMFLNPLVDAGKAVQPSIAYQDMAIWGHVLTSGEVGAIFTKSHLLQNEEQGGARIKAVLEIVGYKNFPTDLAVGSVVLQADNTSETTTAALDYIQGVVDTELGYLWQNGSGVLVFHDARYPWVNPTSATPIGTLGDSLGADMWYLPDVKVPQDALDLWTSVQVQANQNIGVGVMQQVDVPAAMGPPGGFGRRVLQRTSLLFRDDNQALAQAQSLAIRYSFPRKRVDGVTLSSVTENGANVPYMLGAQPWDNILFQRQGYGESLFSQQMLIEHRSIKYQADPGLTTQTWILSPYEVATVSDTPLGTILAYGGATAPAGYGLADGSAVSRTTYADLFVLFGTAFGPGDGSTTFNLPDLRSRFPLGAAGGLGEALGDTGGFSNIDIAHMPAHNHTDSGHDHGILDGPYQFIVGSIPTSTEYTNSGGDADYSPAYNVTAQPTTGNGAANIQNTGSGEQFLPPFLTVNWIVRLIP